MMMTGVIYAICTNKSICGYVFKPYGQRRYKYMTARHGAQLKGLMSCCDKVQLPAYVGVGLNQKVLDQRVEISGELSKLVWYLISNWISPNHIYSIIGMTHAEMEGLSNGYEAFSMNRNQYIEIAKGLVDNIRHNDTRFDINSVIEQLELKVLGQYIK